MTFKLFTFVFFFSSVRSELVFSLNAVLDYGIQRDVRDFNFILGVAIAKGQLDFLEENVLESQVRNIVRLLQNKCDILINRVASCKDPLTALFLPQLWVSDDPRPSSLPSPSLVPPTPSQTVPLLPKPLSDRCLRLLSRECSAPRECVLAEIAKNSEKYEATHQVLYWTILKRKCATKVTNSTLVYEIIKHKCDKISKEHHQMEGLGIPPLDRDLYFEQKVICGVHGFAQFFTHFDDLISSLQLTQGCYSFYKHSENPARDCNLHFSGVMAGTLGLLMKLRYSG